MREGTIVEATTDLWTTTCGDCGGTYAIAKRLRDRCYQEGVFGWRCPYCESPSWWGYGESETDELKRRAERAEARAAAAVGQATRAENRANGYKGAMRKVQKRVARGVCPCCNRTFKDLARHMGAKHPDYGADR